jgi:adenylate kinase family enzyme
MASRIAFAGPMASGKSTAAQKLHKQCGHVRMSIAKPIYKIAHEQFHMTVKDRVLLETIGMTGRALDPDVWINKCLEEVVNDEMYVIDDVRFSNECKKLREHGFKIIWLKVSTEERERRIRALYGEHAEQHVLQMSSTPETSLTPEYADDIWNSQMLTQHLEDF